VSAGMMTLRTGRHRGATAGAGGSATAGMSETVPSTTVRKSSETASKTANTELRKSRERKEKLAAEYQLAHELQELEVINAQLLDLEDKFSGAFSTGKGSDGKKEGINANNKKDSSREDSNSTNNPRSSRASVADNGKNNNSRKSSSFVKPAKNDDAKSRTVSSQGSRGTGNCDIFSQLKLQLGNGEDTEKATITTRARRLNAIRGEKEEGNNIKNQGKKQENQPTSVNVNYSESPSSDGPFGDKAIEELKQLYREATAKKDLEEAKLARVLAVPTIKKTPAAPTNPFLSPVETPVGSAKDSNANGERFKSNAVVALVENRKSRAATSGSGVCVSSESESVLPPALNELPSRSQRRQQRIHSGLSGE
jgi:hypothetical protein